MTGNGAAEPISPSRDKARIGPRSRSFGYGIMTAEQTENNTSECERVELFDNFSPIRR